MIDIHTNTRYNMNMQHTSCNVETMTTRNHRNINIIRDRASHLKYNANRRMRNATRRAMQIRKTFVHCDARLSHYIRQHIVRYVNFSNDNAMTN